MNALKLSCSLVAVIVLAACGGSDNERPEPAYPPLVGISFPPIISSTTSDSVTVHATALGLSNPLTTVAASLNDVAEGEPKLPNAENRYQFDVDGMTAGSLNLITVTANDANLSQSTPHEMIYGSTWMVERGVQHYAGINCDVLVGAANVDCALVVDAARKAVLAINLKTGEKTELSDSDNASEVTLVAPEDMALDGDDFAWIVDSGLKRLVKINLKNNDWTVLGDGFSNPLNQPIAVALNGDIDTPATVAYVLDSKNEKIHQIDLSDGTEKAVALPFSVSNLEEDPGSNSETDLISPRDLAYLAENDVNSLLVIDDRTNSLVKIPLDGNSRSILSGPDMPNTETPFLSVQNITLNANNTKAYISDAGRAAIIEVDLNDGGRTLLVDEGEAGGDNTAFRAANTDNPFEFPSALTIGPNNQLLVVDNSLGVIVQVETENITSDIEGPVYKGERDYLLGGASTPAGSDTAGPTALAAGYTMGRLSGLASNSNQELLYTIDRDLNAVRQLRPTLNLNVLLYDRCEYSLDDNGEVIFPSCVLINALNTISSTAQAGIYSDVLSTSDGAGSGAKFALEISEIDGETKVTSIQVVDQGKGYAFGDVITLGMSGEGIDFSHLSFEISEETVDFEDPRQVAVEFTEDNTISNLYVVDAGRNEVIQIDGIFNRKVFSSEDKNFKFDDPKAAVVVENSLYVLESDGSIIIIDISDSGSGSRSKLDGFSLSDSRAMAVDETGGYFYVASTSEIKKVKISDGTTENFLDNIGQNAEIVDIVLDGDNQRILVLEASSGKIFEVSTNSPSLDLNNDPITGPNTANPFVKPIKMIYNSNYQWLYVLDETLRSLFVVDLQERDYGDSAKVDAQKVVIIQGTALNQ